MSATILPLNERRGVQVAVATHFEIRNAQDEPSAEPSAGDRAVRIQVGDSIRLVGHVPPPSGDRNYDALMDEKLDRALSEAVVEVGVRLRQLEEAGRIPRIAATVPGAYAAIAAAEDPVGPLVRALRVAAGKSQSELAAAMGRHRQTVSRWERGQRSRLHQGDVGRAGRMLGFSTTVLLEVAWGIADRLADAP